MPPKRPQMAEGQNSVFTSPPRSTLSRERRAAETPPSIVTRRGVRRVAENNEDYPATPLKTTPPPAQSHLSSLKPSTVADDVEFTPRRSARQAQLYALPNPSSSTISNVPPIPLESTVSETPTSKRRGRPPANATLITPVSIQPTSHIKPTSKAAGLIPRAFDMKRLPAFTPPNITSSDSDDAIYESQNSLVHASQDCKNAKSSVNSSINSQNSQNHSPSILLGPTDRFSDMLYTNKSQTPAKNTKKIQMGDFSDDDDDETPITCTTRSRAKKDRPQNVDDAVSTPVSTPTSTLYNHNLLHPRNPSALSRTPATSPSSAVNALSLKNNRFAPTAAQGTLNIFARHAESKLPPPVNILPSRSFLTNHVSSTLSRAANPIESRYSGKCDSLENKGEKIVKKSLKTIIHDDIEDTGNDSDDYLDGSSFKPSRNAEESILPPKPIKERSLLSETDTDPGDFSDNSSSSISIPGFLPSQKRRPLVNGLTPTSRLGAKPILPHISSIRATSSLQSPLSQPMSSASKAEGIGSQSQRSNNKLAHTMTMQTDNLTSSFPHHSSSLHLNASQMFGDYNADYNMQSQGMDGFASQPGNTQNNNVASFIHSFNDNYGRVADNDSLDNAHTIMNTSHTGAGSVFYDLSSTALSSSPVTVSQITEPNKVCVRTNLTNTSASTAFFTIIDTSKTDQNENENIAKKDNEYKNEQIQDEFQRHTMHDGNDLLDSSFLTENPVLPHVSRELNFHDNTQKMMTLAQSAHTSLINDTVYNINIISNHNFTDPNHIRASYLYNHPSSYPQFRKPGNKSKKSTESVGLVGDTLSTTVQNMHNYIHNLQIINTYLSQKLFPFSPSTTLSHYTDDSSGFINVPWYTPTSSLYLSTSSINIKKLSNVSAILSISSGPTTAGTTLSSKLQERMLLQQQKSAANTKNRRLSGRFAQATTSITATTAKPTTSAARNYDPMVATTLFHDDIAAEVNTLQLNENSLEYPILLISKYDFIAGLYGHAGNTNTSLITAGGLLCTHPIQIILRNPLLNGFEIIKHALNNIISKTTYMNLFLQSSTLSALVNKSSLYALTSSNTLLNLIGFKLQSVLSLHSKNNIHHKNDSVSSSLLFLASLLGGNNSHTNTIAAQYHSLFTVRRQLVQVINRLKMRYADNNNKSLKTLYKNLGAYTPNVSDFLNLNTGSASLTATGTKTINSGVTGAQTSAYTLNDAIHHTFSSINLSTTLHPLQVYHNLVRTEKHAIFVPSIYHQERELFDHNPSLKPLYNELKELVIQYQLLCRLACSSDESGEVIDSDVKVTVPKPIASVTASTSGRVRRQTIAPKKPSAAIPTHIVQQKQTILDKIIAIQTKLPQELIMHPSLYSIPSGFFNPGYKYNPNDKDPNNINPYVYTKGETMSSFSLYNQQMILNGFYPTFIHADFLSNNSLAHIFPYIDQNQNKNIEMINNQNIPYNHHNVFPHLPSQFSVEYNPFRTLGINTDVDLNAFIPISSQSVERLNQNKIPQVDQIPSPKRVIHNAAEIFLHYINGLTNMDESIGITKHDNVDTYMSDSSHIKSLSEQENQKPSNYPTLPSIFINQFIHPYQTEKTKKAENDTTRMIDDPQNITDNITMLPALHQLSQHPSLPQEVLSISHPNQTNVHCLPAQVLQILQPTAPPEPYIPYPVGHIGLYTGTYEEKHISALNSARLSPFNNMVSQFGTIDVDGGFNPTMFNATADILPTVKRGRPAKDSKEKKAISLPTFSTTFIDKLKYDNIQDHINNILQLEHRIDIYGNMYKLVNNNISQNFDTMSRSNSNITQHPQSQHECTILLCNIFPTHNEIVGIGHDMPLLQPIMDTSFSIHTAPDHYPDNTVDAVTKYHIINKNLEQKQLPSQNDIIQTFYNSMLWDTDDETDSALSGEDSDTGFIDISSLDKRKYAVNTRVPFDVKTNEQFNIKEPLLVRQTVIQALDSCNDNDGDKITENVQPCDKKPTQKNMSTNLHKKTIVQQDDLNKEPNTKDIAFKPSHDPIAPCSSHNGTVYTDTEQFNLSSQQAKKRKSLIRRQSGDCDDDTIAHVNKIQRENKVSKDKSAILTAPNVSQRLTSGAWHSDDSDI